MTTLEKKATEKVKKYILPEETENVKKVKDCILRGVCIVIGITIMFIALGIYVLPDLTSSSGFAGITGLLSVIGLVLYIISVLGTVSHAQQRITFAILGLASMFALTFAAHRVTSPSAVLLCLFASLCIVLISTKVAFNFGFNSSLILPLVITTAILLVVALTNALILKMEVVENVLALLFICIFAVWTAFDANRYAKGEANGECRHDCCEEGVFNIYLNFIEVARAFFTLID
tara:strand:+ start:2653 stop:3351 length:699 start_codon:yes stop_codon:yes gene_type:complete